MLKHLENSIQDSIEHDQKYSATLTVERDLKRLILQTSHSAIFRLKFPILDVKGGKCINGLTVTSKVIQPEII